MGLGWRLGRDKGLQCLQEEPRKSGKGCGKDGQRGKGWGSRHPAGTHLSLFRKHVGAQKRISSASQALPHLSLLSWAHPPQLGLQAGEAELGSMSEDLCPEVQVQGISISGENSLQGGVEGETFTWRNVGVLTGPWSCPRPTHGCAPEAGSGSDCGPGDSPGSWHPSSGSLACSGPAKDRAQPGDKWLPWGTGNSEITTSARPRAAPLEGLASSPRPRHHLGAGSGCGSGPAAGCSY